MERGLSQDWDYSSIRRPTKVPHGTCPRALQTHKTSASETQPLQDKESCFSGHASYIKLSSLQPAPFRALVSTSSLWWLLSSTVTSTAPPLPHPSPSIYSWCRTDLEGLHLPPPPRSLWGSASFSLPGHFYDLLFCHILCVFLQPSWVFKLYKGKNYVLPFSMPPILSSTQAGSQYLFVEFQCIFPWGIDLGSAPFIPGKKERT